MPVEQDSSIVADSTISSSPPRLGDGELDASTPIKRPARTYGRRREEPQTEEAGSSLSTSLSFGVQIANNNTLPVEVIPSSSPRTRVTGSSETLASDDEESSGGSPLYEFSWKKAMRRIDGDIDADEGPMENVGSNKGNVVVGRTGFGQPSLLQQSSLTSLDSEVPPSLPSVSDDIFSGGTSFLVKRSSPQVASATELLLSSPQVAPRARARLANVIRDSDSEAEPSKASPTTTPSSSSQPLHPINTPKSRSLSTTPPTSDDDMPAKLSTKSRTMAKRKSLARTSVPPLELVEGTMSEPKTRHAPKHRSKVKAPTKKEHQEMLKEKTRMAAGSTVAIHRQTIPKTKEEFFAKIRGINKAPEVSAPLPEPLPPSDPIETYSSPPMPSRRTRTPVPTSSTSKLPPKKVPTPKLLRSPRAGDSDSEDLPEITDIVKEAEAQRKKQELQELKKLAMERLQKAPAQHNQADSDDDLEVVNPNAKLGVKEEEERRSTKQQRVSTIRKQQMQLAHVNPSKKKEAFLLDANTNGEASSALQLSTRLDPASLNQFLTAQAQLQARKIAQKKANEWQKHGGRLPAQPGAPVEGLATALQTIAEKGMMVAEANAGNRMDIDDEDDEDDEDEDWNPTLRGSASPESKKNGDESEGESREENDENMSMDQDITMVEADDAEELEESKVRGTRRMLVVSDDEDENGENIPPENRYRRATSSAELPTEDETDKENNTELMYDRSDDKENTAVVRHTPLASGSRSIFDIIAPPSPDNVSSEWNLRNQRNGQENDSNDTLRRPFKDLLSEESPSSTQRTPSNLTQSFAAQLQRVSPIASLLSPTATRKPFIGAGLASQKSFNGFSQFSQSGDGDVFTAAPLLEPGFSDLFDSTTQKRKTPTKLGKGKARARFDEDPSEAPALRPLIRADTLDLTQDVTVAVNLQPPFQVNENLLRKADAIFEKEQAFVVESALHKPLKKPELYINNHGFLTQTKPTESTPEIYRHAPSQLSFAGDILRESIISPSQSRPRAPLRTLSMTSVYQPESPEQPLRRLRKNVDRSPSPSNGALRSPTTPPPKQNAFDLLARGAAKAHRRDEQKQKRPNVDLSEFLENEAAESDDENNRFGMVVRRPDDEEEGEDLDQTLDALMDDKEMDEETVAAQLVLEKFKEQEEEQDKKVEALHVAATTGGLRLKRNRGVGVDDSDDESDDEDNERARRAMKKMRTLDRGDIKDLEANVETRSFAQAYIQSLKDDDEELSYLAVESNFDDVLNTDKHASYEDEEDEDFEEEEMESISPQEIARRARQMIEEGVEEPHLDPLDVSWVDKDTEDDVPRVKTIRARQRVPVPHHDMDALEMDGSLLQFGKPADKLNASSKQWVAQENKSRNAGTSRSVGGSAITGHTKAKSKTGGIHKRPMKKGESASTSSKSVKPERSMLSALADKSRHFA